VQIISGNWKLTITERKRILLENIYGVDIDAQAVETTKLSLLLKVLEGETSQTIQPELLHQRALPDLADNIKCGNSLIASNFYQHQQMTLFNEEERYHINVFDWDKEFSDIFKRGGFDAVISNPPWGAIFSEPELDYLRQQNRDIIVRTIDSFMYFVYHCSQKLNAYGYFGMILPDVILYQMDNQKLRKYIMDRFTIERVLNMGDVFNKVTRPACIIIFSSGGSQKSFIQVGDLSQIPKAAKPFEITNKSRSTNISQDILRTTPGHLFVTANVTHYSIWNRVNNVRHVKLEELVDQDGVQRGDSPDLKEAFIVDAKTARDAGLEKHALRKVLTGGKQVKRYYIDYPELWLIYIQRETNVSELSKIREFNDQFRDKITCKEVKQGKHSIYALHRARDEQIFLKKTKLIGVITEDEIIVALDDQQTFATDGLYLFSVREGISIQYVMGILNSCLLVFIYRLLALESGRVLAQVKPTLLTQLPIPALDFSNLKDEARHKQMVTLVEQRMKLQKTLSSVSIPSEKSSLERQIAANDAQIDHLVYDLYGLTAKEIQTIEFEQ
jgi:hypothetical protein